MAKKTKRGLRGSLSGGLLINNLLGLGFFFGAASLSTAFFPLYLGYFMSSGLHLYERRFDITEDVRSFLSYSFKV